MPSPVDSSTGLFAPCQLGVGFGRRSFLCDVGHSAAQWVVLPSKYLMASWSAVQVPSTPKIQAPVIPEPGLLLGRLRSALFCCGSAKTEHPQTNHGVDDLEQAVAEADVTTCHEASRTTAGRVLQNFRDRPTTCKPPLQLYKFGGGLRLQDRRCGGQQRRASR